MLFLFLLLLSFLVMLSPLQHKYHRESKFLQAMHYFVNAENILQIPNAEITSRFQTLLVQYEVDYHSGLAQAFCKQLTHNIFLKHQAGCSSNAQLHQQFQKIEMLFGQSPETATLFYDLIEQHYPQISQILVNK